jgi:hypothetical protein
MYIYGNISLNSSQNEKCVTRKLERKSKHIFYVQYFFLNRTFYETAWNNMVQPDDNTAHAHSMLDNEGYRHTLRICSTYCFSTAVIAPPACLNVTLYAHCPPSSHLVI